MLPRRPQLIAFGLIAAVAAAAAILYLLRTKPARTAAVERQTLIETSVASGRVVAPGRVQVGVLQTGVVAEVAVEEGARVEAGQLLFRLDDRVEAAQLAQAKAEVSQARARLQELSQSAQPQARVSLEAAEAELRQAKASYDRVAALRERGATPQAELEAAAAALALAKARRDSAAIELQQLGERGARLELARAQLEAALASRQAAEARLAQSQIVARTAGLVLKRDVEPGDMVSPGRTLMQLSQGKEVELVINPDEKSLAALKVGQEARCLADAFPQRPFNARVKQIAPAVDADRGTVEVKLTVPDPPAFLRTDMTVSVEVVTATRRDALVVPSSAVRDLSTAAPYALVVQRGRATRTPVRVGARGLDRVEVLEGLQEDAEVITDPAVTAGAPVRR